MGPRALHQALRPPQHNKFPMARRNHKLGLWVADNIDPDYFWGLLDGLDMRRTGFNVISTSGDTPETLAQCLWVTIVEEPDRGRQGQRAVHHHHRSGPGAAQGLAAREHLPSLAMPAKVGSHFSVLSAVGLLPAFLTGIDVDELLAGAGPWISA